jgi:hypothetical protein
MAITQRSIRPSTTSGASVLNRSLGLTEFFIEERHTKLKEILDLIVATLLDLFLDPLIDTILLMHLCDVVYPIT